MRKSTIPFSSHGCAEEIATPWKGSSLFIFPKRSERLGRQVLDRIAIDVGDANRHGGAIMKAFDGQSTCADASPPHLQAQGGVSI